MTVQVSLQAVIVGDTDMHRRRTIHSPESFFWRAVAAAVR